MLQDTTLVKNKTGLHARPAAQLVKLCRTFESDITISSDSTVCNGKSVFSILSGCLKQGTTVQVSAEGPDEAQALEQIIAYIDSLDE
ncbi:MAG: HPr family phosphocarrier protein [Lachnospiraceae bacterium]|nr:HPr family phosphocarrier protein [Lachnospiraceae bacterium]